jgi:hypothetical protein
VDIASCSKVIELAPIGTNNCRILEHGVAVHRGESRAQ